MWDLQAMWDLSCHRRGCRLKVIHRAGCEEAPERSLDTKDCHTLCDRHMLMMENDTSVASLGRVPGGTLLGTPWILLMSPDFSPAFSLLESVTCEANSLQWVL